VWTFVSFFGFVFWYSGVAEVGPIVDALCVHLMPAFGAILGWLLLDGRIYAFHLAGIGLILAGIALTARGHRADPEPGPE
jgi:drug/metabolite transporter (DMT)-like permease